MSMRGMDRYQHQQRMRQEARVRKLQSLIVLMLVQAEIEKRRVQEREAYQKRLTEEAREQNRFLTAQS